MKKAILAVLILAATASGETISGSVQSILKQTNASGIPGSPNAAVIYEVFDTSATSYKYEVRGCLDDPTKACVSGNSLSSTTDTNMKANKTLYGGATPCATAGPACAQGWVNGATNFGTVNPKDGRYHTLYLYAISSTGIAANDQLLDFCPMSIKWDATNNTWYQEYLPDVSSATPATAAQFAVWADASQAYSIGSSGTVICTVSGTDIKDDGVVGYWVSKHSVPCANVRVVTLGATTNQLSVANFNSLIAPQLAALPASLQYNVIGWGIPSVVVGTGDGTCFNGSIGTSPCYSMTAYFTMYQTLSGGAEPTGSLCIGKSAGLGYGPNNPWFNSGTNTTPRTTFNVMPSMMLGAAKCSTCTNISNSTQTLTMDAPTMKTIIDAATAAIGTNPAGGVSYLAWTNDNSGNGYAQIFPPSAAGINTTSRYTLNLYGSTSPGTVSSDITGATSPTSLVIYHDTSATFNAPTGGFIAGAGILSASRSFNGTGYTSSGFTQVPLMFSTGVSSGGIQTGNPPVAVWGAAVEPCVALPMKMPYIEIVSANWGHGYNAVQSIWKALRQPWVINVFGDPMAQPFSFVAPPAAITFGGKLTKAGSSYAQ